MNPPSVSRQHADWLSLVEVSGPFVSLPVLMRAFPQGLDARDPVQAKALREAFEGWQDNPAAAGKQRAWLLHVVTALLGYPSNQVVEGQALPAGLEARMPEMGETLRPDLALVGPAGTDSAGQAQLLISAYPAEQALDKPVTGRHWKATPATRMMELLHGAGVPLGLVTNGERWMLVYAPRGEVTGYASWYASLWLDEPTTLRAFHSLLGVHRFFGVAADGTLQALLKESASDQQEVTDQLGYQVREAVEVLVQSFDALDRESNRTLLKGVSPSSQYDAALTVMMRLVFLFSAEERGLLHLGKPLYDDNYAVSTLQEQLQEVADQHGEEVLERRSDAWARLLASFRAVHGGIRHQDLLMQAYGGSLFDPDRYAFLEGRAAGSQWHSAAADPLAVNNRVVLHLLNSLQRLRIKGGAGGGTETRRVSFRALGVEQIGHVYEGLLDHTAVRATEPVLGIKGTRSKEPEIALAKLESLLAQGQDKLIDFLKDETGRSVSAIRRTLDEGGLFDEHRLLVACNQDASLQARLRPFAGLIRSDSFEQPLVVLTGSVFVTVGSTRRSTGAHYTPPSLTEPIVQHTLEPLVYVGPAEGLPRDKWKLKSPKEILALKVCDMAMGSGAFLVQVCRYLAERLTEAWENEESRHPGEVLITPDGEFSKGNPRERLVPAEANERLAIARRVVADRCLYGVDINPMAVEMAKLSLWLITMDAHRPFTFLDHAFKCGDSLLGITSLEQLENFAIRPNAGKLQGFSAPGFAEQIMGATRKRVLLETLPSDTSDQILAKSALYAEAEEALAVLNAAADVLVAVELDGLKGKAYESEREASADYLTTLRAKGLADLQRYAQGRLAGRQCLHWALAFPEVFVQGGFDAFLGNPPFLGGKRISTELGVEYEKGLKLTFDAKGAADLCCYFFRRGFELLAVDRGLLGLIATNSITEGDSPLVGLGPIIELGGSIFRASPSFQWPGKAGVFVAAVSVSKGSFRGALLIDSTAVRFINAKLADESGVEPYKLRNGICACSAGRQLYGKDFIIDKDLAKTFLDKDKKNELVVKRYFNSDILNNTHDFESDIWAIDFGEMNQEEAQSFEAPFDHVYKYVKPIRDRLTKQVHEERFWLYWDKRPQFFAEARLKERILVCGRVTAHLSFCFMDPRDVLTEALQLFCSDRFSDFALLQSTIHEVWARNRSSTLGEILRYSTSDAFDTFPKPLDNSLSEDIGRKFYGARDGILKSTKSGLTQTYNRFHNSKDLAADITYLRELQVQMDKVTLSAYHWDDIDLLPNFYETKQGLRFTISNTARREILCRLLELNHQRHAEEVAEASVRTGAVAVKRGRRPRDSSIQSAFDM